MPQIHSVEETTEDRYILDPKLGAVMRREQVMKPSDTAGISVPAGVFDSCPDGASFERQADGTFDVPADVAAHYVAQPGWHEGPNPFPPEPPAETPKDEEPSKGSAKG